MNREIHTNCPDESVLEKIAAGDCPPELETLTLQHAALCNVCGPRLRRYIKIFSPGPLSDSETALLRQLRTSKPDWQREWVRKNVVSPTENHAFERVQATPVPWWRKVAEMFKPLSLSPGRMVMAGTALAVVVLGVVAGPSIAGRMAIHSAQNKVGLVFAERRTTVARVTSTTHGLPRPFPTELGGESGGERDPRIPAYYDVMKAIAENLRSDSADPRWFQIRGRLCLWEATPSSLERAEKDFEKAKEKGLDDPSLEIDLAAAYLELDSRSEHPNLQRSLNLLHEVLDRPKLSSLERATALYDLAVAYERSQAWDLAVSTWEKYLNVDPNGPWADEARQHLKDAEAKIREKRKQGYNSPSYFLDQFSHHNLKAEDPEQYLQKALSLWLPKAMIDPGSDDSRAVNKLAEALEEHEDFWWRDFLRALRPGDLHAVDELNAAITANEHGEYDDAKTHSVNAARVFSRTKNKPGDLRARVEEVYARRNLLAGDCLARADPLVKELFSTKYRWLQGQLYLERAQCRAFRGEFAESEIDAQSGRGVADQFGFPVLDLRILGITASLNYQQGKRDEAWEQSIQGLERYWKGSYPSQRLVQFYATMWQCAKESGSLYASEALLQHTLEIRKSSANANNYKGAMLRLSLRNMLLARKQNARAQAENDQALSLLASIPVKERPKSYLKDQLISDIEPAELQLQQGDPERALATLEPVGETVKSIQYNPISLNFYRVLGDVYLQLKRLDEAAEAYQSAVKIAETGMDTLKNGEERLAWLKQTDECYRGQVRVLLEQNRKEEALERWEWYQSRPLLQGIHSDEKARAEAATKTPLVLSSDSTDTRLVYANFKDGLQIWIANNKGVQSEWMNVRQPDFERAVRDFIERCATPESSLEEVRERGRWLYSKLLQPVISLLPPSQTVVVELDRSANNLSLESLMGPDGLYFGEKYPVSYSPGMRMEQSLRMPRQLGAQERLALLDASHLPGAVYLPGMQEQRNNIPLFFPRTRILDSSNMSWPEARAGLAASDVLHYMGHGKPNGSGTSLDYSKNQSLRATDFSPELLSRSQLIVLAACSSGRGQDNGLLDSNSLVHAFLAAGVPRVIASHWNVDSGATSQLMISFYRNVASNEPVVEAVYKARKEILLSNPHPYYWAGFSLTGRVN